MVAIRLEYGTIRLEYGTIVLKRGGEPMKQPLRIYYKKIGKTDQRLLFPKEVVEMLGREYYFKVYENKVVLEPVNYKRQK